MIVNSLPQAIENIYASLQNGNEDIDARILELKAALSDIKDPVIFDPARLAQGNRQGRKTMQAYFKKRGVAIAFSSGE